MEQYLLVRRIGLGYRVDFRRRDVTAGSRGGGRRWSSQCSVFMVCLNLLPPNSHVPRKFGTSLCGNPIGPSPQNTFLSLLLSTLGVLSCLLGPFHGAIAVPSVTRCWRWRRRGHRCAGGVSSDIWWMGVRRLAVANGPDIFQMLLLFLIDLLCMARCRIWSLATLQ